MPLYFAYGSNMHRADMRERCGGAEPLGPAVLDGWRFMIMSNGYASIRRELGAEVRGVLWRVNADDLALLDAYEDMESGLYVRRYLSVRRSRARCRALAYVGSANAVGQPLPGYQERVVAAAEQWRLPGPYLRELRRWRAAPGAGR